MRAHPKQPQPTSTTGVSRIPRADTSKLTTHEIFWRDHQEWLETQGYMLRPRYRAGWIPEWKGKDISVFEYEDGLPIKKGHLLDATRISTGELVMLKRISKTDHPTEIPITRFFSSEPIASHPRNHGIPLLDVLDLPEDPDIAFLVLPLLRPFNNPEMETVGEATEFFRQLFEGLQFIHECNVAHRDCMFGNIMMDPRSMFPKMFHPRAIRNALDWNGSAKFFSRTARPTKYYFIDFGLSLQFDPEDSGPPRAPPIEGGDKSVPEFQDPSGWYERDPYPTDVYYVGNVIRNDFLQKHPNLGFMKPLVDDMVQDDPMGRPTADQVVERFAELLKTLSWWTLSRRLASEYEDSTDRFFLSIRHFFRTAGHAMALRSTLPSPKP